MELLFTSICDKYKVQSERSSEWLSNLKAQYSSENRHFHNVQMLEMKLALIVDFAGDEVFKDALILAALFQYYHYDVKRDLKKENCDGFKLFIDQTGIKDVSIELLFFRISLISSPRVFFRSLS